MRSERLVLAAFALAFFAFHITYLAPSLEDIDSVNFALAIHDFDPANHRPHPPGYPVFVALTKVSSMVLQPDSRAIAFWGVLAGALSVFPLARLFGSLEALRGGGLPSFVGAAVVLTMTAPLFWFTAVRPLSDTSGLVVSLVAQAVLATAFMRQRENQSDLASSGRLVVLGALLSGLAIGVRSQAAWLTLPLLIVVVLDRIGRDAAGAMLGSAMTFSIGVLVWAIPMLAAIGDPSHYLTALLNQGGEDLTGVEMLATTLSPRLAALSLWRTFVAPWESSFIGWIVIAAATVGAIELAVRGRAALVVIVAIVLPYALFHLVFHETATIRYALPLMPAVVYLAIGGVRVLTTRAAPAIAAALAMACLWIAHPSVAAYGADAAPVVRGLRGLERDRPANERTIGAHQVFGRALEASGWKVRALPAPPRREWLELGRFWRSGSQATLWFLADPKRTDLALVDPRARRLVDAYRWPFHDDRLLGGARPSEVDVYAIATPGWFADEGFALTPETAGVAREMSRGPSLGPIRAWVRRRSNDATLMVGGRHLGQRAGGPVRFQVSIDGRDVTAWTVEPASFFLRFFDVSATDLAGGEGYAPLDIRAVSASGNASVPNASVEQFDVQDAGAVVVGFGEGWHEPEFNPATGVRWRWMSDRAVLRVRHGGQPLTLRVRGESPMRYFEAAPAVIVRADAREIARYSASDDFDWTVQIPASTLDMPEGQIVIETDRSFVPAEQRSLRRNPDPRRLGLRIYEVTIDGRGRE